MPHNTTGRRYEINIEKTKVMEVSNQKDLAKRTNEERIEKVKKNYLSTMFPHR